MEKQLYLAIKAIYTKLPAVGVMPYLSLFMRPMIICPFLVGMVNGLPLPVTAMEILMCTSCLQMVVRQNVSLIIQQPTSLMILHLMVNMFCLEQRAMISTPVRDFHKEVYFRNYIKYL